MSTQDDGWRGAVFYQIYPRSFLDTNGDGIGDLPGITQKLDYVASLGVDGIWISPFFTSPMRDFGYDVADYCAVDPIFGTLGDFDALLARAHALGLKVIIDLVFAHTSDAHAWFGESRSSRTNAYADWYVWADPKPDGSPPNNWQSIFSGPSWTWDARRRQYYLHNFLSCQPALNTRNPQVQDALLDVCRFWLDRGVDGFRLDAVNHAMCDAALRDNPARHAAPEPGQFVRTYDYQRAVHNISQPEVVDFLKRIRAVADSYGPCFLVAEVGGDEPLSDMVDYTRGEERLNAAYSFDLLEMADLTPLGLRNFVEPWLAPENAASWPAWAFSNHDRPRALTRLGRGAPADPRLARLLLTLLVCLRGNAFIYQGEELGLPQGSVPYERLTDPEAIANWPETLGRDGTRTPMPWNAKAPLAGFSSGGEAWLPIDPAQQILAVDQQHTDPDSVLAFTRLLLAFRRSCPSLRDAPMAFVNTAEPLLVFTRTEQRGDVLCCFNLSDRPCALDDIEDAGEVAFARDYRRDAAQLGPYGLAIIRRSSPAR